MLQTNKDIRSAIKSAGIKNWQVAIALGISEMSFYRLMRTELPAEKRQEFLAAIDKLAAQEQGRCGQCE